MQDWMRICRMAAVQCDVVVSAIGLRPRIDMAAAAGIKVNRGIEVDRQLQTAPQHLRAG